MRALDVNDDDAVFRVFREFAAELGTIDRVVVNAGLGKGAPLGTGRYDANKQTAMTNFVAALAQTEAAMEIFRDQNAGHLVMVSLDVRGPRDAEEPHDVRRHQGRRRPPRRGPARRAARRADQGDRALPGLHLLGDERPQPQPEPDAGLDGEGRAGDGLAIEKEKDSACVPALPWAPLGMVMRHAPMPLFKKLI